jgi:hypothetical protein
MRPGRVPEGAMSDPALDAIRGELSELKRRVDELETRLETRISAAEHKELLDVNELKLQVKAATGDIAGIDRKLSGLASLQRAGHLAVLHLLGVTARAVKVSEAEIAEAMKLAEMTS